MAVVPNPKPNTNCNPNASTKHTFQARSEGGLRGLKTPQPSKKVRFLEVVKSWYGYVGIQEQDGAEKRLEARFYTPHF